MDRWVSIIKRTLNAEPVYKPENQCCFTDCFFLPISEHAALAEQGEQKRTEELTGLLPVAETNFESTRANKNCNKSSIKRSQKGLRLISDM